MASREQQLNEKRNDVQDGLRGFLVLLAICAHFGGYLHAWYVTYFSAADLYSVWNRPPDVALYAFHNAFLAKPLPLDSVHEGLAVFFSTWVTQLFIALSGFNLARKASDDIRKELVGRVKVYLALALLFFCDGFVMSSNFGYGLSNALYPVTMWFLLLAIVSPVYAYFDERGIVVFFIVVIGFNFAANLHWIHPITLDQLTSSIHPWAKYPAEPVMYLPYCLLGVLVGTAIRRKVHDRNVLVAAAVSLAMAVAVFFTKVYGLPFDPNAGVVFEDRYMTSNFGIAFTLFLIASILLFTHVLRRVNVPKAFDLLKWVSINAVGIFLIHRTLFIRVLAPIRLHVGSYWGQPMTAHSWEILFFYLPATLMTYLFLKRVGFFGKLIA